LSGYYCGLNEAVWVVIRVVTKGQFFFVIRIVPRDSFGWLLVWLKSSSFGCLFKCG